MFVPFHRFAVNIAGALTATDLALDAATSAAILAKLPNTGDYTRLTLSSGALFEFVKASRNGTALVISRAQEGSTARVWASGDVLGYELTPQTIIDTQRLDCGACDDAPVAPLPDGLYQNATLRVAGGAVTQIASGTNVIVQACDECPESATPPASSAPVVSGENPNLLTQDANGLRVQVKFQNSTSVGVTGVGTAMNPFVPAVIISPDNGNTATVHANGLYVPAPDSGGNQTIIESDDIDVSPGSNAQLTLKPTGVITDGSSSVSIGPFEFDEAGRLVGLEQPATLVSSVAGDGTFITATPSSAGVTTLGFEGNVVALNDGIRVTKTGATWAVGTAPGFVTVADGSTKATVSITDGIATIDAPGRTIVNTDGTFIVDLLTDPNQARLSAGPRTLNGRSIYMDNSTQFSGNGITYAVATSTFTITGVSFGTQRVAMFAANADGVTLSTVRTAGTGDFRLFNLTATAGGQAANTFRTPQPGDYVIAIILP